MPAEGSGAISVVRVRTIPCFLSADGLDSRRTPEPGSSAGTDERSSQARCSRRRPDVGARRRRRRCAPSFASPTPGSCRSPSRRRCSASPAPRSTSGSRARSRRSTAICSSGCRTCSASTRRCRSCSRLAARADEWLRKPNSAPLFGGHSALDRMLGGQVADLYVVRQYLDAQRGGKA